MRQKSTCFCSVKVDFSFFVGSFFAAPARCEEQTGSVKGYARMFGLSYSSPLKKFQRFLLNIKSQNSKLGNDLHNMCFT